MPTPQPSPPRSKHAVVLDILPTAEQAPDHLRDAGHPDVADAVQHVLDYARTEAQQERRAAAKRPSNNRPLPVDKAFRAHVHAEAAREGAVIADVVRQSLEDFINGEWTPPAPVRAARGTGTEKVMLNIRADGDLWDEANAHGKDPAAVKARGGYKLTAATVSIASLIERFGLPGDEQQDEPTA